MTSFQYYETAYRAALFLYGMQKFKKITKDIFVYTLSRQLNYARCEVPGDLDLNVMCRRSVYTGIKENPAHLSRESAV